MATQRLRLRLPSVPPGEPEPEPPEIVEEGAEPEPPETPSPPHEPPQKSGLPQSLLKEITTLSSLVQTSLEQTRRQASEAVEQLREAYEAHQATREALEDHAADLMQAREELREVTAALIRLIENTVRAQKNSRERPQETPEE